MLLSLLVGAFSFAFAAKATADDSSSCRTFVQSFYNWYVVKSKNSNAVSAPLDVALRTRAADFSAELSRRLKEDTEASAKSPGEVVGLDFDPILNSQEEATPYKAEKVSFKGNDFLVDVFAIKNGKKSAAPVVQPELSHIGGKWQFVNFHYKIDKKDDDLLNVLKILRDDRKSTKK